MRDVAVLSPPYREPQPRPAGSPLTPPPPLGAIALCRLEGEACLPLLARFLQSKAPWKPVVVIGEPRLLAATATDPSICETLNQPALLELGTLHRRGAEAALTALNTRPDPPSTLLAAWLAQRLRNPTLASLILVVLDRAGRQRSTASPRTLRWQVHRSLRCHPSDLIRLARLATLRRLCATVDALAADAGSTVTRLRERVGRGLGVSLAQFNSMPGWEWVLEAAIRQGLGAGDWGLGAGGWPSCRWTCRFPRSSAGLR